MNVLKHTSRITAAACAAAFLAIATESVRAHEEEKHPIDAAMDKASEKDPSTGGRTEAIDDALESWDKLLNESYQKLKAKLDRDGAKALRDSQRAWIAWRDKEIANLDKIYGKLRGTMYVPMHAYAKMNLTRQRALQLERLAELAGDID